MSDALVSVSRCRALFLAVLPIWSIPDEDRPKDPHRYCLELAPNLPEIDSDDLRCDLWLSHWEGDELLDLKQQEVMVVPQAARTLGEARLSAYFDGWARAARTLLSLNSPTDWRRVERLMPYDCFAPSVLKLRSLHTAEGYERACLIKTRMGRWL